MSADYNIKNASLKHRQGRRLHPRLCIPKHRYAHRRPLHKRSLRRHLLRPSPRIHLRIGTAQQTRPSSRGSAMGNHLGHHDHVLHLLRLLEDRWHRRVPHPMGRPNDPCDPSLHRHVLPPRITPLARAQRSLGRLPCRAHPRPRQRRPEQPFRHPRVPRYKVHVRIRKQERRRFLPRTLQAEHDQQDPHRRLHADLVPTHRHERYDVLHHIRLRHGRPLRQQPPRLLQHPIRHQRDPHHPSPPLRRPLGPSPHPPARRPGHDDLDVR